MNDSSNKESRNIDPNLASNKQQRIMLQPIDNLLINHHIIIRTTEVLINNLMNNNVFTMNLTR